MADRRKVPCTCCGAQEGERHVLGCYGEQCPFCGGRLICCDCYYETLGIDRSEDTWAEERGLTVEQWAQWEQILQEKGRIPWTYQPTPCVDCGVDVSCVGGIAEYYLVHDHVWAACGLKPKGGELCIGCLERRLGRQLTRSDFVNSHIHAPGHFEQSARLRDRLAG
jgi:hypothetical protein